MRKFVLTILVLVGGCAHATPLARPIAERLRARVSIVVDVRGTVPGGNVVVALYADDATFLEEGYAARSGHVVATDGSTRIAFDAVPAGRYAAVAYQDANADGKLGRSLVGWPTEPFGFSNGGSVGLFGPPSFDDCAFDAERASTTASVFVR
ncbi:MAG: DUF2141 domain-containing protein [Polyangiaceae bacterium]